MKSVILAAAAVATLAGSAMADYTVTFGGPQTFGSGTGFTTTTPALTGTVTGIIFHFDYSNSGGQSWASDMQATVDSSAWGGYNGGLINGATFLEGPTGAAGNGNAVSFTSGVLNMATPLNLSGQSLVVGYGNGWTAGGTGTLDNVTITLVGTVPTPGAAAALGLAGLAGLRRRR